MSVCMQYLDSNDTIKMDINPSYGVHTVESWATAFSTTDHEMNSDMQDNQLPDSSHDHNHYDCVHHESAQHLYT